MSLVTYTGTKFDYLNPKPEMIDIDDIFRSLPRLNRFVGHSTRSYSVGEHTIYCLMMAEKLGYTIREQLLTFMHDFEEAYTGDCPAPLKRLIPDFSAIASGVEDAIYEHFGIEPPTDEEYVKIKRIDLTMLVLEMRDLTVHEFENFINEGTYTQFLEDDDFNIYNNHLSEQALRYALHESFKTLMIKYNAEHVGKNG
jgi:uncharacterized protein